MVDYVELEVKCGGLSGRSQLERAEGLAKPSVRSLGRALIYRISLLTSPEDRRLSTGLHFNATATEDSR